MIMEISDERTKILWNGTGQLEPKWTCQRFSNLNIFNDNIDWWLLSLRKKIDCKICFKILDQCVNLLLYIVYSNKNYCSNLRIPKSVWKVSSQNFCFIILFHAILYQFFRERNIMLVSNFYCRILVLRYFSAKKSFSESNYSRLIMSSIYKWASERNLRN